jgi:hypothetical protein
MTIIVNTILAPAWRISPRRSAMLALQVAGRAASPWRSSTRLLVHSFQRAPHARFDACAWNCPKRSTMSGYGLGPPAFIVDALSLNP